MKITKTKAMRNSSFLMNIVQIIERKIQRRMTEEEENMLISCIKNISNEAFRKYNITKISEIISVAVIHEIQLNHCSENNVDIHELLRKNMNTLSTIDEECEKKDDCENVDIKAFFGVRDFNTLVKKIKEPINSVNTAYIILDSRNRSLENDGTKYLKWTHINSIITSQGTCNSIGNIRDIISVKLAPYNISELLALNIPLAQMSCLIHEMATQSFITRNGRFHFMGDVTRIFDRSDVKRITNKDYNDALYKFNKPITNLDTITVSFFDPIETLTLFKDRMEGEVVPGLVTTFVFPESHNLVDSRVYINNFTTATENDTAVVSEINATNGHNATVISLTEITIPVDTSQLQFVIGATTTPFTPIVGMVSVVYNSRIITGNNFLVDFDVGDYIVISGKAYRIQIVDSTEITVATSVKLTTNSYTYDKTTNIISADSTQLCVGDIVKVLDSYENEYKITKIISDAEIEIDQAFIGDVGTFNIEKNNLSKNKIDVFFGMNRIVLTLEFQYLSAIE